MEKSEKNPFWPFGDSHARPYVHSTAFKQSYIRFTFIFVWSGYVSKHGGESSGGNLPELGRKTPEKEEKCVILSLSLFLSLSLALSLSLMLSLLLSVLSRPEMPEHGEKEKHFFFKNLAFFTSK